VKKVISKKQKNEAAHKKKANRKTAKEGTKTGERSIEVARTHGGSHCLDYQMWCWLNPRLRSVKERENWSKGEGDTEQRQLERNLVMCRIG